MKDKEYIHLYELNVGCCDEVGNYKPLELKHTKLEVERKTAQYYYFTDGSKVSKKSLDRVQIPNFTRVYLPYPDNERARELFTEQMDELIHVREADIALFMKVKKAVAEFKD